MLIVDSQIHLWQQGHPHAQHRQAPYLPAEALSAMDVAGVTRAINHPPPWDPGAVTLAAQAAQDHSDRLAWLGWFPVERPESRALVAAWARRPGLLGLRFSFNAPEQRSWPTDGTLDWLWPSAEQAGLPIGLAAARFLPVVGRIAERHPALKLHVDHMGVLQGKVGSSAFDHLPDLLALARLPNVAVKLSAVPAYATDAFPFRSLHDPLRRIVDAFGPRRCFWGTDITRMPCSWSRCVELFTEQLPWLQGEDLAWVMGRAVCEWLDWPLPAAEADQ